MGGTPATGDNTDELVDKIATVYDPATSELPDVTSSDKNKYLHTNNSTGDLEWAEASGGVFPITVTRVNNKLTSDKEIQEIREAISAGLEPFVISVDSLLYPNENRIFQYADISDSGFTTYFVRPHAYGGNIRLEYISIYLHEAVGGGDPYTDVTSESYSTHSIPSGGTTGQALTKNSNTNYDCFWTTVNDLFLITITERGGSYVSDKTFDEITSAFNAGKYLIARYLNGFYLLQDSDTTLNTYTFQSVSNGTNNIWIIKITISKSNNVVNISLNEDRKYLVTAPNYGNVGDVLTLINSNNYEWRPSGGGDIHPEGAVIYVSWPQGDPDYSDIWFHNNNGTQFSEYISNLNSTDGLDNTCLVVYTTRYDETYITNEYREVYKLSKAYTENEPEDPEDPYGPQIYTVHLIFERMDVAANNTIKLKTFELQGTLWSDLSNGIAIRSEYTLTST